jgi:hypothetical protein
MSRVNEIQAAAARFWPQVDVREPNECWAWAGKLSSDGYGMFTATKVVGNGSGAHRFSFFLEHGYAPRKADNRSLDHLCRNRACVNPRHLEDVPHGVNVLRGNTIMAAKVAQTHCKYGHPLAGDNLYIKPNKNERVCRVCQGRRKAEFDAKHPGYRPPSQRRSA